MPDLHDCIVAHQAGGSYAHHGNILQSQTSVEVTLTCRGECRKRSIALLCSMGKCTLRRKQAGGRHKGGKGTTWRCSARLVASGECYHATSHACHHLHRNRRPRNERNLCTTKASIRSAVIKKGVRRSCVLLVHLSTQDGQQQTHPSARSGTICGRTRHRLLKSNRRSSCYACHCRGFHTKRTAKKRHIHPVSGSERRRWPSRPCRGVQPAIQLLVCITDRSSASA